MGQGDAKGCPKVWLFTSLQHTTLQHTLQHTAAHSSAQHTVAYYNTRVYTIVGRGHKGMSRSANLHRTAICYTATHWNILQHTATYCPTLQHTCVSHSREGAHRDDHGCGSSPHCNTIHCNTLQRNSLHTHCNTLQHTATHCNTLQRVATHCNACVYSIVWRGHKGMFQAVTLHHDATRHTATNCNTLQHTHVYTMVGRGNKGMSQSVTLHQRSHLTCVHVVRGGKMGGNCLLQSRSWPHSSKKKKSQQPISPQWKAYGVAMTRRLLKIMGLFCKRDL